MIKGRSCACIQYLSKVISDQRKISCMVRCLSKVLCDQMEISCMVRCLSKVLSDQRKISCMVQCLSKVLSDQRTISCMVWCLSKVLNNQRKLLKILVNLVNDIAGYTVRSKSLKWLSFLPFCTAFSNYQLLWNGQNTLFAFKEKRLTRDERAIRTMKKVNKKIRLD